jgi:hypothetical protein
MRREGVGARVGFQSYEEELGRVIQQIDRIPHAYPQGVSAANLLRDGVLQEGDLLFDRNDVELAHQYAALAVVSRDLHLYLEQHPRPGHEFFDGIVAGVQREDSTRYGSKAFPKYEGLPAETLPAGMAAHAEHNEPDLTPLIGAAFVHEWTFKAGKRLLVKFLDLLRENKAFMDAVCGRGKIFDQLTKGEVGQQEVVQSLAAVILQSLVPGAIWISLAALLASIFVKRGLRHVCQR